MSDPIWSLVASSQTNATAASGTVQQQKTGLEKDAFMRLLLSQMTSQDPLSPMDGQAFFTQLAQLSLLEQMYQLNDTLTETQQQQQLFQAGALIGREVDHLAGDGSTVTGIVRGVRMVEGEVRLDVDGEEVSMSEVLAIRTAEAS